MTLSVLIVCLGNICRSPMGEAVLKRVAKERDIDMTVDSCGTAGYHVGEEPDDRHVKFFVGPYFIHRNYQNDIHLSKSELNE
jgi:low molecular weight phosphotyrosine protein phosphatase